MALSVRTRFEVFKRDEFTCRYCGQRSPEVILEVDHIVPECEGGSDDPINLTTSCWDCNRGKAGVPLASVMTGEDPHDRAIEILERKRQLEEYNRVLEEDLAAREADTWWLWRYWQRERGYTEANELDSMPRREATWIRNTLTYCPRTTLQEFMDAAMGVGATSDLRYVKGCVRNWRETTMAAPGLSETSRRAVEQFESIVADLQRACGLTRDAAVAALHESQDTGAQVERDQLIEEVLLNIREAEYQRRNRGHCHHDPKCTTFSDCVQHAVRILMGLPPSAGAPPRR